MFHDLLPLVTTTDVLLYAVKTDDFTKNVYTFVVPKTKCIKYVISKTISTCGRKKGNVLFNTYINIYEASSIW